MTLMETNMMLLLTAVVLFIFVRNWGLLNEIKYNSLYFVFDKKQCD